nr:hypothetical protein [Tanacetum cinerariifolium]
TKLKEQMTSLTSFCEMTCQIVQKKLEEKQIKEEQAAKAQNRKLPVCYDDDDDEEESNSLKDNNISELPSCSAVTPNKPVNSLSMGDEHLDTILATESDEVIKSCVEDLFPIPSESEGENSCDVPSCFTTFSNILFDDEYEFDSVDDQSLHNEDFLEKIFSNPVENLIPIPSESEGIPENICDVPCHDNSLPLDVSKDQFEDFFESNDEFSSIDEDSFSIDNIDYVEASPPDSELVSSEVMDIVIPEVEASPPDSELVSSEVMEIVTPEVGGIKASNDNPIPSYDSIISGTPPNLTPSGESEFFSEVDAFLAVEDESTSSQFPNSDLDPKGDMLLFESFLNNDPSSESQTKSSSTSLNSLLEETNNFHNSLPECTTFSHVLCDAECESQVLISSASIGNHVS